MKALILSGGEGTRLRPITHTEAKQLIPVANKPILFYGIEAIKEAGITEVGIVVGDTHQEIKKAVGEGKRWGVRVSYIHQEAPSGLAHAVKISEDFLKKEPFVMYLGDNIIRQGIKSLVDEFRKSNSDSQILLAHVDNPQQFGVAELKGDKVVKLVEKPQNPKSDLALVGVYMFGEHIFEAVNNIKPSWRGELEITDAIQYLIDKGYQVSSHIINGWWKDTGKKEDLLEANRIMLENLKRRVKGKIDRVSKIYGRVDIDEGAEVTDSVIRGPAIIAKGSRIINSYVGPFTSIYYNTLLEEAEVEHSIIMEECKVIKLKRIEDSLIGRGVVIEKSNFKPRAYRFMLGDSSRVGTI
ncbi:MAG: glucose-1-phosphate thymidylyltransferase [Candidatus Aerophobetes bacterium]|nr:glucose-1-phosphate thymidylyltransferase [Candidatus Aerophobetes bacterium]